MPSLKLPQLPDRTQVKRTVTLAPELEKKLRHYAELYQKVYGTSETIEILIPHMLSVFLDCDREFMKTHKVRNATNINGNKKAATKIQ